MLDLMTTLLGLSTALYVVLQPHPVLAVLALIFLALITAVRWLSYGAVFFALMMLLIYLGAVLVLFLFVVMTLSQEHKFLEMSSQSWRAYYALVLAGTCGSVYPWMREGIKPIDIDFSVHNVAFILSDHAEMLMQWMGLFLLLTMFVAIMLLSKTQNTIEEE